jgi:hypothetical protein
MTRERLKPETGEKKALALTPEQCWIVIEALEHYADEGSWEASVFLGAASSTKHIWGHYENGYDLARKALQKVEALGH